MRTTSWEYLPIPGIPSVHERRRIVCCYKHAVGYEMICRRVKPACTVQREGGSRLCMSVWANANDPVGTVFLKLMSAYADIFPVWVVQGVFMHVDNSRDRESTLEMHFVSFRKCKRMWSCECVSTQIKMMKMMSVCRAWMCPCCNSMLIVLSTTTKISKTCDLVHSISNVCASYLY